MSISQLIKIKENPTPGNLGLEKEGRSKFPGCIDTIQPSRGRDGRWRTGLDENALHVLAIQDSTEREEKKASIIKLRTELEELTGLNLDALSEFWNGYFIKLDPNVVINLANPLDRIKYHVMLESDSVAPSLMDATRNADYRSAKYYIAREFEEVGDRVAKRRRRDEAGASLLDIMKTPDKAIMIGNYLGLHINNNTPSDNVYDIFQTYLENDEREGSIEKFLSACSKSPEEISTKIIFNEAFKLNVIRQRDGLFQRGNITMGRSPGDVLDFLSDIKNSAELLSIQEEIEMKKKFG